MLMYRKNLVGSEPISHVKGFFCSGHAAAIFLSGELKSFVYEPLASFSLRG